MSGEKRIMALCDTEEEYAQLFTDFMKKQGGLPWEVHTYTSVEELLRREKEGFDLLAVSESAYTEELQMLCPLRLVVLNESGILRWDNVIYVDKYQPAEEVLRFLLQVYAEIADSNLPRLRKNHSTAFIGIYSPVHRSMQTTLSLTIGQILAQSHPTLYLNFEYCAGIGELLPDLQTYDLADLLYFLNTEKEKFRLRMQTICRNISGMSYVPPMKSGQNLLAVSLAEWMNLLQKIEELGEYEYVILDLSESVQGLYEILRMCSQIYTIAEDDKAARGKLLHYEQLLAAGDFREIADKTKRLTMPKIRRFPEGIEQYTRGELAAWTEKLLKEME